MLAQWQQSGLRRGCMVLIFAALIWAYAIVLTGGFILDVGFLRVSSRSGRNPLIGALLAAAAAWVLTPAGRRRQVWLRDYFHLAQPVVRLTDAVAKRSRLVGGALAGVLAAATVALGILLGAHVAGGADSYAYLSQARLWGAGTLRVEQPLIKDLPPGVPAEALAPLGYRLSPDRASLVPIFPPGLPMLMAVFERAGGATAMFYVMPLLAGLSVYVTYAFGTMLAGPLAGVLAALLMATSPAFVFQVTHAPMSDIAAAGWWVSALLLLSRVSRSSALVAGFATGAAILTRPNLVPLALIPGGLLLWELRADHPGRRIAVQRLLLFAAASIPACLVIALLNRLWYGSPLQSGYGPLAGSFFQWEHGWPNLQHYWRWAMDSQTPLIVVALAAPVLAWRHLSVSTGRPMLVVLVSFVLGVYACYAFYLPFDDWWFLRFLLPAFPASFALMSVALVRLGGRLPGPARWMAPVLVVAFVVSQSVRFGWANSAYYSAPEWRFAAVGQHIAARLPKRAIFVANLHSGSARYYSGRMTIQYDNVPPEQLDALLAHVERAGYSVFLLVDDAEAPDFIASFSGRSAVGSLDWPPVAAVSGVKIYETAARAR